MLNYIIRRLMFGVLTLLLISFLVYALIRAMPGNPAVLNMDEDPSRKVSERDNERMRAFYGLDQPWPVGWLDWISHVAHGSLGQSMTPSRESVAGKIGERIGPTLLLSVTSLTLSYLLALPLGLYMTARGGKADERGVSMLLYMLYSFPAFVAALLLQIAFAVYLDWLPLAQMYSDNYEDLPFWAKAWDVTRHAILPVTCETYGVLAYYSRFVRSNMEEVVRQDYIRTARAKGVGRFRVLTHHALRNTMIPLVTMLGLSLPGLLSGSVILEQIFTWPGLGRLFYESIGTRDYPMIMGLVLIFSTLTLLGQLLADVLYAVVDPRVTYS